MTRAPRSRYRSMGQASDAAVGFDVQGTYQQVAGTARTAQSLAGSIQQFGDSSVAAQQAQVWQGMTASFNQIVPGSGTILDAIYNVMPHAGAGPGYCVTDPPNPQNPLDPSWPHFVSFDTAHGPYPLPAAGSFEAFAYPIFAQNAELEDNCMGQLAIPWKVILAATVAAWNQTHQGPARTLVRSNLTAWGGKDPLAWAMMQATAPPPTSGWSAAPGPDAVSVAVNGGPFIPHVAHLNLVPIARAIAAQQRAAATASASSSATKGAVVVGAGLSALALVAYRLSKGLSALPKLSKVRSVGALVR